jgi:hypothetical protein
MAFKVQVVDDHDRPTGEKLKRSTAEGLVRRFLVDWVVPRVSVRRRKIGQVNLSALPRPAVPRRPCRLPQPYQHHIEPKIVPVAWQNSAYQRYLEGYGA